MTEQKEVVSKETGATEVAKEHEAVMRPLVDIFEDQTGITLQADMPGVSKDRLSVHIEHDALVIEGTAVIAMPEGMEALYADIGATRYQRRFSLSRELDGEKIEANLRDGVLTLRIPKRDEHKPRKIEVRAG